MRIIMILRNANSNEILLT